MNCEDLFRFYSTKFVQAKITIFLGRETVLLARLHLSLPTPILLVMLANTLSVLFQLVVERQPVFQQIPVFEAKVHERLCTVATLLKDAYDNKGVFCSAQHDRRVQDISVVQVFEGRARDVVVLWIVGGVTLD
jgi:hypothetical protein